MELSKEFSSTEGVCDPMFFLETNWNATPKNQFKIKFCDGNKTMEIMIQQENVELFYNAVKKWLDNNKIPHKFREKKL